MSKLNNEIKSCLLSNGFQKVDEMPSEICVHTFDYQYDNGEYFVCFNAEDDLVLACYSNNHMHELYGATSDQVIAYFQGHGETLEQY